MIDFVKSLEVEKKLLPTRNPEISWFCVFFPALIGYFALLTAFINQKPFIGSIEILDPSFEKLIYKGASMEIISNGSIWTEGPLWIEDAETSLNYLYYTDTKLNRIFRWEEGKGFFTVGKSIQFEQAGCRSNQTHCSITIESGPNGLARMHPRHIPPHTPPSIDLLACQHGERAISLIKENGTRSFIATHYKGRRFNSPNDLVWSPEGDLYFTDPPYGLYMKETEKIGSRELPFNGLFMIPSKSVGEAVSTGVPTKDIILLSKSFSRPNGLAFAPDFSKLYVSNSDVKNAYWKVFDVADNGTLTSGRVFYNATEELISTGKESPDSGAPDGMKVCIHT
jgi:gluconolactonase